MKEILHHLVSHYDAIPRGKGIWGGARFPASTVVWSFFEFRKIVWVLSMVEN